MPLPAREEKARRRSQRPGPGARGSPHAQVRAYPHRPRPARTGHRRVPRRSAVHPFQRPPAGRARLAAAVSANAVRGARLAIDETVFLHVEAEHRTFSFDHTATFTVSGPRGAIDRLLLQLRAALASLPPPDDASGADAGDEPGEAERD